MGLLLEGYQHMMFNLGIAQLCVNISDLFVFTDDAVYDALGEIYTQCV